MDKEKTYQHGPEYDKLSSKKYVKISTKTIKVLVISLITLIVTVLVYWNIPISDSEDNSKEKYTDKTPINTSELVYDSNKNIIYLKSDASKFSGYFTGESLFFCNNDEVCTMSGSAIEGNFDGELIIFKNNLLSSEITYDRGIIVGTYKSWYTNTNQIRWESNYNSDGQRHGSYKSCYRSGILSRELFYIDGDKISEKCWDENGNVERC